MQFQLANTVAKVTSFNPRAEKHGEENIPAGDIKIEVNAHSSLLDSLDRSYRPFLFRKPAIGEQTGMFEGDDLTALDKPNLAPLRLKEEFPGYTLTIVTGMGLTVPMALTDVELSSFVIEAVNGGSVILSFSATCHPDEDQAGKLCQLIQNKCEITLEPPKVESAQGDILDEQEARAAA